MSALNGRPLEILLVEDNSGDVVLTKDAFQQAKMRNHIQVAEDGEVALNILNKQPPYEDAITPDLILLDLNLPKMDGKELLTKIKNTPHLKRIPVVILTSSNADADIMHSYDLHANSYIVKPVNLKKLSSVVESIENFWFTVVVLPQSC